MRDHNLAFIDGQNLHLGTTKCDVCAKRIGKELIQVTYDDCTCGFAWRVSLPKFRTYLRDKYDIAEAYYYLGNLQEKNEEIYNDIQKAGFIVKFKEHTALVKSKKKGNVDTDIVFDVMKNLVDNKEMNKVVLVSGDGDYKRMVDYLISKDRFAKILFPNSKYSSSLYNELGSEYFDQLQNLKKYIMQKEKGS